MTSSTTVGNHSSILTDPKKRRWLAWGALALVFLLVNIHRLSTAVLSDEFMTDFALSAAQLGTLHAAFFIIYAIVQIPTGIVVDRIGPRHIGAGGAILLSLGAVGLTLSTGYTMAIAARVVIGFGSGVIFVSIMRFSANWYRTDEFATMTGMTGAFAGLGAIIATTPLAIAVGVIGWRTAVGILAIVGVLTGVAVFVLVRNSPSDAGLQPIENVPEHPSVSLQETGVYLRTLARDPGQWLLSVVFFATSGTVLTLIGLWGVPYLVVVYDLDIATASTYTLLGAVGMLFGGPIIGWLSDRFETRYVPMVVGLGVFAVAHATIAITGRPPLFVVALVYTVSGFLIGSGLLSLTLVKERYAAGASGVATATVNTAGFVGAAILPWAIGLVLDAYRTDEVVGGTVAYTEFGYRVAFAITATTLAFAFLASALMWYRAAGSGVGSTA